MLNKLLLTKLTKNYLLYTQTNNQQNYHFKYKIILYF